MRIGNRDRRVKVFVIYFFFYFFFFFFFFFLPLLFFISKLTVAFKSADRWLVRVSLGATLSC
jgi:hypothetical protein